MRSNLDLRLGTLFIFAELRKAFSLLPTLLWPHSERSHYAAPERVWQPYFSRLSSRPFCQVLPHWDFFRASNSICSQPSEKSSV